VPNRSAARKTVRQDETRRLCNKTVKSRLRTEENKLDHMIERGDKDGATRQARLVTKLFKQAAAAKVMHPNRAARKQAQMDKRIHAATAPKSA
jgi:small subunit ribosomal protein S20